MNSIRASSENSNPSGLCQCGCGQPAPLATQSRTDKGHVKGQPTRFIAGHYAHSRRSKAATRFWQYVQKSADPDGCWLWTGAVERTGYGRASGDSIDGRRAKLYRAHRLAWELVNGPIPDGLLVCHKCDVKNCVRPDHLFLGTNTENALDASAKGLLAFGERNPSAKVTAAQVQDMRRRYAAGEASMGQLSREYGIAVTNVSSIIHRKHWRHVR